MKKQLEKKLGSFAVCRKLLAGYLQWRNRPVFNKVSNLRKIFGNLRLTLRKLTGDQLHYRQTDAYKQTETDKEVPVVLYFAELRFAPVNKSGIILDT